MKPGDPEWDDRWCGWPLGGERYCKRWTMMRPDRKTRTRYCPHHQPKAIDAALVHTKGVSYILREELSAKVRHFLEEVDLLDFKEELAIARAYLSVGLERWADAEQKVTLPEIEWVFGKIDKYTQLIERAIRIRNETALTAAEIHYLQIAFATVFQKWIPAEHQRRALEDVYRFVSEKKHPIDNRDFLSDHGTIEHREAE